MLATGTGQVWAGYFDEGICGNYGWGEADSEEPVGAYAIVRFSPGLEAAWHYPTYTEVAVIGVFGGNHQALPFGEPAGERPAAGG